MSPVAAGFLSGAVMFVVAELVCRQLLNLDDGLVPLIVFPLTGLAAVLTFTVLGRRSSDGGRPPRQ